MISFTEAIREAGITKTDTIKDFIEKYSKYSETHFFDPYHRVVVNAKELEVIKRLLKYTTVYPFDYFLARHEFPLGTEIELEARQISDGVIFSHLFAKCGGITKITLSGSCDRLGNQFVCSCIDLKEIDLTNFKCNEIGPLAFALTNIEHLTLPEGIKEIRIKAFASNKHLESIKLPSSIKSMKQFDSYKIGSPLLECPKLKLIEVSKSFRVVPTTVKLLVGTKRGLACWEENQGEIRKY